MGFLGSQYERFIKPAFIKEEIDMANNIDQDLLDEIRFDIKVKDLLKGKLVLQALEYVKRDTQKKALFELSRADEDFAIPLFAEVFVNSPEIAQSFSNLKETMYSKILGRPEALIDLLAKDIDPKIKTFLVGVVGEIRLTAALPVLLDLMTGSSEMELIEALIAAMGGIGDPASAKPISDHLQSESPKVMFAAVNALGELATAEAMALLDQQLGTRPDLDHAIIDIFSKAQTPEALAKLNATLTSQHAHIRTTGKQKLGEIGTMSVRVLTKNLSQDDPDLVVHSLNVLGDIGDRAATPAIRKLLHSHPDDANIRFAAYETLGRFDDQKGAFTLAAGLEDPVDNVRSAAAKAIDRNYNGVLAGGIRNLTSADGDGARKIIETIVDAQCEKIFLDLLEEDFFQPVAMEILTHKVHPEIRAFYVNTLNAKGYSQLAEQIALEKPVQEQSRLKVFAVDDSKMMLNIYRTVLHNLGYESMIFEYPSEILEKVENDKPDAIITDLNMPEITGIELTRRIRKWYTKDELPIIMITTQDEIEATQEVQEAGINGILRKPFTESQVRLGLKQYAGLIAEP